MPDFTLETSVMKKVCKYHKRKGQEFAPNDVVRDFCPDAFYVAYPSCLALLYGAGRGEFDKGRVELSCPNPQGITFEVERVHCRALPLRLLKRAFEWVVKKVIFPLDWEDWHIRLTVRGSRGGCPMEFPEGKTYWFNIGRLDEFCPASFHGIYPVLLPHLLGHGLAWQKQGGGATVHCPDHEGMVYAVHVNGSGKKRGGA